MIIEIDKTEEITLGRCVMTKRNISSTMDTLQAFIHKNENELEVLIDELGKEKDANEQELIFSNIEKINKDLETYKQNWNLLLSIITHNGLKNELKELRIRRKQLTINKHSKTKREREYESKIKNFDIYTFPQLHDWSNEKFCSYQTNLNNNWKQGDFRIRNGDRTVLIELAATMKTLKDKIKYPDQLLTTFNKCKRLNISFRILVVLPSEDEDLYEWLYRAKITNSDFDYFMKMKKDYGLPIRTLKLPNAIYSQPIIDYFIDEELNRKQLIEKQELIMDKVITLAEAPLKLAC